MRKTAFLPVLLSLAVLPSTLSGAEEKGLEKGEKIYRTVCCECHKGKESLEDKRMSRAKWKEAVDRMVDSSFMDPAPSKGDLAALLDYLEKAKGAP